MAKFVFNGKTLSTDNYIENLMIKSLIAKYGEVDRILSASQFLSELENANITNSLDSAILILKKFSYNLSNQSTLNKVKPYLTRCAAKSILMLNRTIKESKINKASYYRAVNAYLPNRILNESFIDSRKFTDECDYLSSYLTNAILCGEIIFSAEAEAIKILEKDNSELEKETIGVVDSYVRKTLNLDSILNATNPTELAEQLAAYSKQNTRTKKVR